MRRVGATWDALCDGTIALFLRKQETIALVAVGVAILGAILITTHRLEDRIDRAQTEIHAEIRADRQLFTREILRLTSEHARFAGIVDGSATP